MNKRFFVALSALSALSITMLVADPVFAQRGGGKGGGKGGGNRGGDGGSRQRSAGGPQRQGGGQRVQSDQRGGQRATSQPTRTDFNQVWRGSRGTQTSPSGGNIRSGRDWTGPNSNQWTRGDNRNYYRGGNYSSGRYYGYGGYPGYGYGYPGYYGSGFGLGLGLGYGLGRLGIPGIGFGYGGYGLGGYGLGYGGYGYGGYGPYTTYSNGYSSSAYADTTTLANTQTYVTTPASANEFLEAAKASFLAGDYANAQRNANHAVIDGPQDPKTHEMMSLALFAQGEFRGAAAAAHAVAELGQVADWPTLYRYYRNRDKYVQHLDKLKEVVKEHPDVPDGRFLLGYHYKMLGHNEQAQKQIAEYLKLAPNDDPVAVKLFSSVGGDVNTLPKRESVPEKVPVNPAPAPAPGITTPST